jgi:hypothetical protein
MARTKPTGVGRGGRREGAGRKAGSKNRRTLQLLARAKLKNLEMPVDRLLRRMNDPRLSEEYRDQLAQAVAPDTAARLSAVSVMKRPRQMSDQELDEAIQAAKEDALRTGAGGRSWPRRVH